MRRALAAAALAVVLASLALFHDSPPAAAASHSVLIENYAYSPSSITVNVGDTITWTNEDTAPHTVTTSSGPQTLSSPYLSKGQSWSFTFSEPGTYSYYCAVHPYMRAQVIVRAAAAATTHAAQQAATHAAAQPQRSYVPYPTATSHAAAAPAAKPSMSGMPTTSSPASAAATATATPAAQTDQQQVADAGNIRTLSPVLLLSGLTAAIAVFCLLLVGSRAAAAGPAPDDDDADG